MRRHQLTEWAMSVLDRDAEELIQSVEKLLGAQTALLNMNDVPGLVPFLAAALRLSSAS